jgi:hypothetical protein
MSRIYCLLIAALIVGFTADLAPAQIGRGRLLKKMRDDLFGSPEDRVREEAAKRAAEQKRQAAAQQKAQLEAQRRAQAGRQPTPVNQTQNRNPTQNRNLTAQQRYQEQQRLLQQQRAQQQQLSQQQRAQQLQAQQRRQQATSSRNRSAASQEPTRNTDRRAAPKRQGFGMATVEKGDKLFVAEIIRGGNADEAGLKRGDQIVGIGGVEVENEESFEEIAEILNAGDNIEIAFKRRGRTDEVQVGYGNSPEAEMGEQEIAGEVESSRGLIAPNGSSVLSEGSMARQVEQLSDTVERQRRVIEQLESQIRAMQRTSAPGPNIQAPSIRSGNSILQSDPKLNR